MKNALRVLAKLSMVPALLAGVAAPMAVLAAGAAIVSCADENDPKTWVKRLDDATQRPVAVRQLQSMWDQRMVKANKDRTDKDVVAFIDVAAEPLSRVYAAGGLDDITKRDFMKLISDLQDPRVGPALKKALDDFDMGKGEDDARDTCEAITAMATAKKQLDQSVLDSLWNVFAKYNYASAQSGRLTKAVHDAILAVKSPSFGDKAVTMLGTPVDLNKDDNDVIKNQLQFWQLTAVQVIRDLKYTKAIKTLTMVLIDQNKLDLNGTVKKCLIGMAKDAEPVLNAGLAGTDPDLKKIGDTQYTGAGKGSDRAIIADMVGYLGRPAGRDAILAQLDKDDPPNDIGRTAYALALTMVPSNAQVEPHFIAAFNKISPNATAPFADTAKARTVLIQSSAQLYDPNLVDLLLGQMTGGPDLPSKLGAMNTALELAPIARRQALLDAFNKIAPDLQKTLNTQPDIEVGQGKDKKKVKVGDKTVADARDQIAWELGGADSAGKPVPGQGAAEKCNADSSCYVAILDEPIPSGPDVAKWRWVKACYMAVVFGGGGKADATRGALVAHLDKVKDKLARLALVQAIDELAPAGDAAAADAMQKIVDTDSLLGDTQLNQANDNVQKIIDRLRARAM